jgi:hypothetical protein
MAMYCGVRVVSHKRKTFAPRPDALKRCVLAVEALEFLRATWNYPEPLNVGKGGRQAATA